MNLLNLSIKRKLILMTMLTSSIALLLSDRKSTRLNSSHDQISYAVFCLKKKKQTNAFLLETKALVLGFEVKHRVADACAGLSTLLDFRQRPRLSQTPPAADHRAHRHHARASLTTTVNHICRRSNIVSSSHQHHQHLV